MAEGSETSVSHYEGKRLPKAKWAARQHLPIVPECLEEIMSYWQNSFSAAHPVQAGSAFDCVDMKEKGFYHMPPQSVAGMQQQCEEKKTEGEALPYMKETLPPPPGLYYSCDPAVHWHGLQDPQMPSSTATSTESTQTPKQEALPKKIFCFVGSSGGPSTLPGSEEEEAGLFNQVHLSQLCS